MINVFILALLTIPFCIHPQQEMQQAFIQVKKNLEDWHSSSSKPCKERIIFATYSLEEMLNLQNEVQEVLKSFFKYRNEVIKRVSDLQEKIEGGNLLDPDHFTHLVYLTEENIAQDRQEVLSNFEGLDDVMDYFAAHIQRITDNERTLAAIKEWGGSLSQGDKAPEALTALNKLKLTHNPERNTDILFKIVRFTAQQAHALHDPEGPVQKLLALKGAVENYQQTYDELFDALADCNLEKLFTLLPLQHFLNTLVNDYHFFDNLSQPEEVIKDVLHNAPQDFSQLEEAIKDYHVTQAQQALADIEAFLAKKGTSASKKAQPKKAVPRQAPAPKAAPAPKIPAVVKLFPQFKQNLQKNHDAESKIWGKLLPTLEKWTTQLKVEESADKIIITDPALSRITTLYLVNPVYTQEQIVPAVYPIHPRVKEFLISYDKNKDQNAWEHTVDPFTLDVIRQKGIVTRRATPTGDQLCKNMLVVVEDTRTGQKLQGALQAAWGQDNTLYHLLFKPARSTHVFTGLAHFLIGDRHAHIPDFLLIEQ